MLTCEKCGRQVEPPGAVCRCVRVAYSMNAEPGEIRISGHPVGVVVEGPLDSRTGRRVESQPASGGRATSETDGMGAFKTELEGQLEVGRSAEGHAVEVLTQALRDRGHAVERVSGGRDDRGQDALLIINGQQVSVQIVSLPSEPSIWRELSRSGVTTRSGTGQDAVDLVRQALLAKRGKALGALLVLDAAHVGGLITEDLGRRYSTVYDDPSDEFGVLEAWIVGPTARSALRLGRPPSSPAV